MAMTCTVENTVFHWNAHRHLSHRRRHLPQNVMAKSTLFSPWTAQAVRKTTLWTSLHSPSWCYHNLCSHQQQHEQVPMCMIECLRLIECNYRPRIGFCMTYSSPTPRDCGIYSLFGRRPGRVFRRRNPARSHHGRRTGVARRNRGL